MVAFQRRKIDSHLGELEIIIMAMMIISLNYKFLTYMVKLSWLSLTEKKCRGLTVV